jgi:transposase InsO family protein
MAWPDAGSRRWRRTGCGCVTRPRLPGFYVAFVTDVYARRILGWRAGTTMSTQLTLDAIEQAIWTRQRVGTDGTDRWNPL